MPRVSSWLVTKAILFYLGNFTAVYGLHIELIRLDSYLPNEIIFNNLLSDHFDSKSLDYYYYYFFGTYYLEVGIGNPIFSDFLPIYNIKRQWGTRGESGVLGGGG